MKIRVLKCAVASVMLSLLAGCIVLSVYPFYASRDLISDPGLTGSWGRDGRTNEVWRFAAASGQAFLLTTTDDSSTNNFSAHVFALGSDQFLDLQTTQREPFQLPLHLIAKFNRTDTNLTLPFLDYGWLTSHLATNPAALRHIVVPQEPGNTNGGEMLYLTSNTRELQKFLVKHVADTNAFSPDSLVQLHRLAP